MLALRNAFSTITAVAVLLGCSSSVSPGPADGADGAGGDAAQVDDAPSDTGPDSMDASSPRVCRSNADCAEGQMCMGTAGCDTVWMCQDFVGDCTPDRQQYCGCDGRTFESGGLPCVGRQYAHEGPCESPPTDAGTPSCTAAWIDHMGNCRGPVDQAYPAECCAGVANCDQHQARCDAPPPACPPGRAPSIVGGCWGPCVPFEYCAPIACDPISPRTNCPQGTVCSITSRTCERQP